MNNQEKTIAKLNELLTRNYDSEAVYKEAVDIVENNSLKTFLNHRAKNRYDFGHALKSQITAMGGEPDKGTSLRSDFNRAWMNLKDVFTTGEGAVLDECAKEEEIFIEAYQEVLEDESNLPPTLVGIIKHQRNESRKAQQEIENLRNSRES